MRERGGGEEGGGSEWGEGEKVSEGVLGPHRCSWWWALRMSVSSSLFIRGHSLPFMVGGARRVFVLIGHCCPSVVSCWWRLASFCSVTWPLMGGMPFRLESGDAGGASGQSRVVVAC